jgi:signal peptidase II
MFIISVGLITLIFVTDFLIKNRIERKFQGGKSLTILGGKCKLQKLHNRGFAFGMAKEHERYARWISALFLPILLIRLLILLRKKQHKTQIIASAFLLGGAASNTYDRLQRGYVVDYLSVCSSNSRISKIVFNLSDLCILIGTLLSFLHHKSTPIKSD